MSAGPRGDASDSEEAGDDGKGSQPSAAQRLAQSRERMRQWMLHGDGRHEARRRAAAAEAQGQRPAFLDRLRSLPVVGVVADAIAAWWSHHPLHGAATLAESVAHDTLGPLVRRHPVAVLALAFAAGAAAVRWRPWRWVVKPAIFGGLASQVISHLVSEMPIESWVDAMTAFSRNHEDAAAPASPQASGDAMAAEPSREPEPAMPG
ncbi:MAG TPA: hypothetical protein VJ743_04470 [Albitalea sp.]|nr:hypothetical protein [Albitalea sp.]